MKKNLAFSKLHCVPKSDARKAIMKAARRIFNSDKICRIVVAISILASLFWNTVYMNHGESKNKTSRAV